MSLSCKIKNVEEWKAVLDAISTITEDAMFIVNTDGISFRCSDSSHIALLDITFPKSSFEKFEGKTSFFGLRVDNFKTAIDSAGNNDVIDLHLDDRNMQVKISGSLNMKYKLRLLEKSDVNQPVPKCSYKSKVSMQPSTLARILSNLERYSEFVSINASGNHIKFSGRGDSGDADIDIDSNSPEITSITSPEKIISNYSLEYMIKVIRGIGKASKMVDMEYDTDKPMRLDFDMPSTIMVKYYLAPRVE